MSNLRWSVSCRGVAACLLVLLLSAGAGRTADWPAYRQFPSGSAIVLLTFVHGADRKGDN